MKPLALLPVPLLLAALLAGCAAPPATSILHIDYGGQLPSVEASVDAKPGDRPAAAQRAAHGGPSPPYYTAFDQIAQWSAAASVPIQVSYSASFGFFLAQVAGLPANPSDAYWSLSVNGTTSQVGMEQVHVVSGSRIAWTLTPLAKTATTSSSAAPVALAAPTPPYWCYKLNGVTANLGIPLQPVKPGHTVPWEFAGCS